MKKTGKLKAKVLAVSLAVMMAMSSVTTFAASYKLQFGSLYNGPNVIYSKEALKTTSDYKDKVTQITSSFYETYYYLATDNSTESIVVTKKITLKNSGTEFFTYKSGYGGNGQKYYLKGVAEERGNRPAYTVSGTFTI